MRFYTALAITILAVLSSACATSTHVITGKVRPSLPVDQVQVYATAPSGSVDIAILMIESDGWTRQGELDAAVLKLKSEAASLGANGVVIAAVGTETSGAVGNVDRRTGMVSMVPTNSTVVRATAIYVPDVK